MDIAVPPSLVIVPVQCCLLPQVSVTCFESREPPGVGTADGEGVHCSRLDVTHVCFTLARRAFIFASVSRTTTGASFSP